MKFLTMLAIVLGLGLSSFAIEAEAKRFGGGRSLGMKRQAAPPKAPASQNATQGAAAGAAAGAPKRSWMGPLAGIAAGLGLAALASHLGFGEGFGSILLIGLAVMAGLALFNMLKRQRAAAAGSGGGGGMRYAHETPGARFNQPAAFQGSPAGNPGSGSMIGSQLAGGASASSHIPADFDVAAFERNAKVNFIRLQAAHDAGDLDDIRQFTSPEVFAEIRMDLSDRKDAVNQTEVIDIQASVLEVAEDDGRHIVSVRFTGSVREDGAPTPEAVDEIWHMTKPVSGSGGWIVAGIQQHD